MAARSPTPELLAQAAIGYEEACWRPVITDPLAVELLEPAAAALGRGALAAARRRARRPRPRAADARRARARRRVRDEAVAMARELGDRAALAGVLAAQLLVARHEPPSRCSRRSPRRASWPRSSATSSSGPRPCWRVPALLVALRPRRGAREVAAVRATAERTAQPFQLHVGRALRLGDRALRGPARRTPRRSRSARTSGAGC